MRLRFDVIKNRASEILHRPVSEIGDAQLAVLFGVSRETIWRFRTGRMGTALGTALRMASVLSLPVADFTTSGE